MSQKHNITQKQRYIRLHTLLPIAALPAQVPHIPEGYTRKPVYTEIAYFSHG